METIVGTPWRPQPAPADATVPRVLPPLPADQQLRNQPRPEEPEVRAPLRPRISKHDVARWGFSEGCPRCRQIRSGKADGGTKHSEKCRQRLETEMRRENDPRIKRAEDKHTELEADKMRAQEAIDARRAAKAAHRGGGGEADGEESRAPDSPPETAGAPASSSSGNGSPSGDVGNIVIADHKKFKEKFKDMHYIDKNIAEIVRDNKELENTIDKITNGSGHSTEDKSDIIDMLNDMMREGKEGIMKLIDMKTQRK